MRANHLKDIDNISNILNTYNYFQVIRKKLILNYITKMTFINYYFTLLKQIDLYYISIINIKSDILTITLA